MRFVSAEEAAEVFPPVWEALRRERPGVPSRSDAWWKLRRLRIPDEEKANPRRFVALDLDGSTQAFAVYRREPDWDNGVSTAKLDVQEAIGATPQATAEIWRYLLDVDWTETITASLLPPDHPLFLLAGEPAPRALPHGRRLWVRLVDVGAALSGRAYAGEGAVVFEVRDEMCPWNEGRWEVSAGEARRTDAEADLALDVSALGSAYLGAVSFAQLQSALRVEELRDGGSGASRRAVRVAPPPLVPGDLLAPSRYTSAPTGAVSSVGRAPARQAGGHWFEPSTAHSRSPC